MPQGNKAMVVAWLKPRALCQHPEERMQECGSSLELSPEYGQCKAGGSQGNAMVGALFYLTPAALDL